MLTIRPPNFLFVLPAILIALAGCRGNAEMAAPIAAPAAPGTAAVAPAPAPAAPATAAETAPPSADDVARLIRALGHEEIAPGEASGGMQFFAGEFDRYRCPAADDLSRLDRKTVAPALKRVLADSDAVLRRNAAITLARLGDASGADLLYDLLDDTKVPPIISGVIINSLASLAGAGAGAGGTGGPQLRWARLGPAFERWQNESRRSPHGQLAILTAAALADDQPAARRLLLANLQSRDPALRHAALQGAASMAWPDGPPSAAVAALDDGNPRIVLAAVAVLNAHGQAAGGTGAAIAGRLAEMCRHGDWRVRQSAIAAIVKLKPANAAPLLLERIDDPDLTVQRDAVRAMADLGDLDGLRAALATRRFRIRQTADRKSVV